LRGGKIRGSALALAGVRDLFAVCVAHGEGECERYTSKMLVEWHSVYVLTRIPAALCGDRCGSWAGKFQTHRYAEMVLGFAWRFLSYPSHEAYADIYRGCVELVMHTTQVCTECRAQMHPTVF